MNDTSIKVDGKWFDLTELSAERFVMAYNAMVGLTDARREAGWSSAYVPNVYYIALGDFFRRKLIAWSSDNRLVVVD